MTMDARLVLALVPVIFGTLYVMGFLTSKSQFQVQGRTVVVTGGSQGLGLSVAKQLASKGAHIVIVARDQAKLTRALTEISSLASHPKQRFHSLSYDLTDSKSATAIVQEVTAWNDGQPPDALFSCAGSCEPSFFASASLDTHRSQMDTIYWSCAYMAHATLSSWMNNPSRNQQPRHIIFTSSVLAFLPMAGYAPYNPAKAAMRSLADTINQEVAVYNGARSEGVPEIKVHCIFPMGILSPGYEKEQLSKPKLTLMLEEGDKPQTCDDVATASLQGLEAGQYMITTQLLGHVIRGAALASSVRNGGMDLIWNFIGSIAMAFYVPDLLSKCRKWGKENGMDGAK